MHKLRHSDGIRTRNVVWIDGMSDGIALPYHFGAALFGPRHRFNWRGEVNPEQGFWIDAITKPRGAGTGEANLANFEMQMRVLLVGVAARAGAADHRAALDHLIGFHEHGRQMRVVREQHATIVCTTRTGQIVQDCPGGTERQEDVGSILRIVKPGEFHHAVGHCEYRRTHWRIKINAGVGPCTSVSSHPESRTVE